MFQIIMHVKIVLITMQSRVKSKINKYDILQQDSFFQINMNIYHGFVKNNLAKHISFGIRD